jgi:hypothetical protein
LLPAVLAAVVWTLILGTATASAARLTATWTDNSDGLAAFEIQRKRLIDTGFVKLASVPAGITRYVDATVSEGVTYCYRVRAYNAFGTSSYSPEACGKAAATTYDITTIKGGDGLGTVKSNPTGVSCGTDCTGTYAIGTVVNLAATAASGSRFAGWGGSCSGTGTCVVSANTAVTVKASFTKLAPTPTTYTITATRVGDGLGTVKSNPTGITCGTDCTGTYAVGTVVSFTATAAVGSRFVGWAGACSGTGTCLISVKAAVNVAAYFAKLTTSTSLPIAPYYVGADAAAWASFTPSDARHDTLPAGHALAAAEAAIPRYFARLRRTRGRGTAYAL